MHYGRAARACPAGVDCSGEFRRLTADGGERSRCVSSLNNFNTNPLNRFSPHVSGWGEPIGFRQRDLSALQATWMPEQGRSVREANGASTEGDRAGQLGGTNTSQASAHEVSHDTRKKIFEKKKTGLRKTVLRVLRSSTRKEVAADQPHRTRRNREGGIGEVVKGYTMKWLQR